jgi:hypothetical protein
MFIFGHAFLKINRLDFCSFLKQFYAFFVIYYALKSEPYL